MRLFLSSQELGDYPEVAVSMSHGKMKLAYSKNSQDNLSPEQRNFSTKERKAKFEALGFEFEELDLREYFGKKEELRKKMKEFGSVFCAGGNTFILRRAMKASGFDEIIVDMLENDEILYGGWSAGACITAHSLKELARGDLPGPKIVSKDYPIKETIWNGLGLVDFFIVPHCNMDWFKKDAEVIIRNLKKSGQKYYALDDGQVVVIEGSKTEVLK
ncbi:MAG: peptidase E [bacterium]|nr:peptidase E [bacterium]